MFDSLLAESVVVFALGGIGIALVNHKNYVMKLAGALFCLFALVQALQSPALLGALALAGALYVTFLTVRAVKKARKGKKCARCEHADHGHGLCANAHCNCPR